MRKNIRQGDFVRLRNEKGELITEGLVKRVFPDHYFVGEIGIADRCIVVMIDGDDELEVDTWVYRNDKITVKKPSRKSGA